MEEIIKLLYKLEDNLEDEYDNEIDEYDAKKIAQLFDEVDEILYEININDK